jgi:hypothetical protein
MQITTPLEKIEKISYRYSLEDAKKPLKRLITRLLLHHNAPTLYFFYEILKNTQEEFKQREEYKELHEEHKRASNQYMDDLTKYSDEGLLNFEKRLSKEMQGVNIEDLQYDALVNAYNELHDELIRRGLVEFPF